MVDILALCVASDFKVMNDSVCADRKEHQYAADDISAGHNEDAHHFHRLTTIRIIDGLMKEMKDMMICDGCKDFQKYGIFIIRLNEQISLLTESLADTVPEDLKGFVVEDVDNYMENFRNNELNSDEAQIQMRDFCEEHFVESASDSSGDSLKIPDVYHLGGDQSTEHCAEPIHCDDYRHDLTGDRDEAQDIIADEDRTQLLLLKEQSLISSLLTKLESASIIAVQTNLLRIVEHAVERAFDPRNPRYHLLPQLANMFIRALICNERHNKALTVHHSERATFTEEDIMGLGKKVTWGDIASGVTEKALDKEDRTDVTEEVVAMLAEARTAVSLCDLFTSLESFVSAGLITKRVLGSLVSLAIVYTATSRLTFEMICSQSKWSMSWREEVEKLCKAIRPGTAFSLDENLSDFMMEVLRPGLSSEDKERVDLSCRVMIGILKILNLTQVVTKDVRLVILAEYKAAQSMTVEGRIDQSQVDYCAGAENTHTQVRSRMVLHFMICFAHDVLEPKLKGATTGRCLVRKLLSSGQETIRKTFNYSFFDTSIDETKGKLSMINKLITTNDHDGTRSLLVDSVEQVEAIQTIMEIALGNPA